MTAAKPPKRPAGEGARRGPSLPASFTLSALEDLAALAARLLGAPWAAVRLGEGADAHNITPSGQQPLLRPAFTASAPAREASGDGGASLVVAGPEPRALDAAQEATLAALARQAGALLRLDRQARAAATEDPAARRGAAEAAPEAIASHYKTFLDHLPTVAVIKDRAHRYTWGNRAFWKLVNGTGEEGDPSTVAGDSRLSPESWEKIRRSDLKVLETGEKHEFIERLSHGGEERAWWTCKFPVSGADGSAQIGVISLDVSELDRAQADTRMYDLIFRNVGIGVIVWRLDDPERLESFRIVAINAAAARMIKVSAEEMLGQTMDVAYPENIRQGFADLFRKVVLTGEPMDLGEVEYSDERIGPSYFTASLFPLPDQKIGVAFENITERRIMQDRLKRSVERFELIAKATNDALFEADLKSGELWWNDRVYELLGYAPGAIPPSRDAWLERVHPEDRERVEGAVKRSLDAGDRHFSSEYRILRTDGGVGHIYARGYVVHDAQGAPARLLGAMTDISGLKRAEEALKENEERYRKLVETLPDVIGVSIDGKLEFINPAGVSFRGASSAEEMVGKPILEFFHPDDRAKVAERQRRLAQGEAVPPVSFRFLRADGTTFEAESRAIPFPFRGRQASLVVIRDVSERKRAEEALRRSEEHYRLLFHGSPLPMYLVDLETLRFVDVNRAAEAQYGFGREEFLALTLMDIRPEEDVPFLQEKVRRIRSESGSMGIWRHRRRDGTVIQAEIVAHPLQTSGLPGTVMVIAQDVTERLEVLERLRLSEERHRTLAALSPVGLFRGGPDGHCNYINEHLARMVGVGADRLMGRGWTGLLHPEDRERVGAAWARAFEGGRAYQDEYRFLRPDGKVVWVLSRALSEKGPDGKPIGYVGTVTDITERKQAEILLAGQKRTLAMVAAGWPCDGVLEALARFVEKESSGLAGGILLSDPGTRRLAWAAAPTVPTDLRAALEGGPGVTDGGPAALAVAERRLVVCADIAAEEAWTPGGPEALRHGFRACLALPILGTNGGALGAVLLLSRAAGEPAPFDVKLLETAADLAGIAVERRRQEEIGRLNQELSEENRRILEANRMKSEFLASMSHELRTPLNAIIGFSQLLIDRKVGPLNDKQAEYLGDVLDGGMHLLRLINDVLDLAKIESGKMQLHREAVPVPRAVREVCDILVPMALAKSIDLRVSADLDPPEAFLDSQKFKQVLYNLASNAIKFSHVGGEVRVEAARDPDGALRVRVADRGIGIRREDLGRLFQEFQQLDSGAARHFPGTGLGLVITKKLVELHGGMVSVESEPGAGSTFFAVFPAAPLPEAG